MLKIKSLLNLGDSVLRAYDGIYNEILYSIYDLMFDGKLRVYLPYVESYKISTHMSNDQIELCQLIDLWFVKYEITIIDSLFCVQAKNPKNKLRINSTINTIARKLDEPDVMNLIGDYPLVYKLHIIYSNPLKYLKVVISRNKDDIIHMSYKRR